MKFFKQLFCKHCFPSRNIPNEEYDKECGHIFVCEKCGKEKVFWFHDYKEIDRYIKNESTSGITVYIQWQELVKILECTKCGDIITRKYNIS